MGHVVRSNFASLASKDSVQPNETFNRQPFIFQETNMFKHLKAVTALSAFSFALVAAAPADAENFPHQLSTPSSTSTATAGSVTSLQDDARNQRVSSAFPIVRGDLM